MVPPQIGSRNRIIVGAGLVPALLPVLSQEERVARRCIIVGAGLVPALLANLRFVVEPFSLFLVVTVHPFHFFLHPLT